MWLHLLKQTTEFSKENLEEFLQFVPKNRRLDLMPEVLRAAVRRFPSFEDRSERAKIIWTVQGWAAPETFYIEGDNSNNVPLDF